MAKEKKKVNYLQQSGDRQRMGYYLRVKSFKKIAGSPILGKKVTRRRIWLAVIVILIFFVGVMYTLF